MDSLFGIKGKDFVIVASESTVMRSIMKLKHHEDKSFTLDDNTIISMSGDFADLKAFGNFLTRNVQFLKFKNNKSLTVNETAEFTRNELAEAIRKSPYQVNSLLSGYDNFKGA